MKEKIYEYHGWSDVPGNFTGMCILTKWNSLCYYENGELHRIGGWAYKNGDCVMYYLQGYEYTEKEYWNHPLVVEYKAKEILEYE